jgi:ribose 5-phosphate isomerase B
MATRSDSDIFPPAGVPAGVLVFASDHAGTTLKDHLIAGMAAAGYDVIDLGAHPGETADYPDKADALALALAEGRARRGVLICGSGIGIAIAANRHRHIRAALCHDVTTARLCRRHNDANVLVLGARIIGEQVATDCLDAFLLTEFEGGRHQRRVTMLNR